MIGWEMSAGTRIRRRFCCAKAFVVAATIGSQTVKRSALHRLLQAVGRARGADGCCIRTLAKSLSLALQFQGQALHFEVSILRELVFGMPTRL